MRIALTAALAVAAACVAGCIWLVLEYHVDHFFGTERRTTFLVGELDSSGLYLLLSQVAAVALLVAVLIGLRLAGRIPNVVPRRFTYAALAALLVIGIPMAGLHLFVTAMRHDGVYTEIQGAGVERDLVIREWSVLLAGGGDVFERNGSMLTLIGTTGVDDGGTPFARGDYSAVEAGGVITLEWKFNESVRSRLVIGDPAMPPSPHDGLYHDYVQNNS